MLNCFHAHNNLHIKFISRTVFRSTVGVERDIAEFGVWRGSNSLDMAKLSRILDLEKTSHAFDSFQGLPQASTQDNINYVKRIYVGYKQLSRKLLHCTG